MIRIGVDGWNLPGDHRGPGRYLRALLARWLDEPAYARRVTLELVVPEWATRWVAPRYRREIGGRHVPIVNRRAIDRRGYDLLWAPFNGPAFDAFRLPCVATLHDAAAFVLPGFTDGARRSLQRAARRCARVLTDSHFSAGELARTLGIDPSRIDVVHLGADPPRPPAPAALEVASLGRYVLFVGSLQPYKGLDVLQTAFARLRASHPEVTLVVAGAGTLPDAGGLRALGHVDDATLAALYRGAAAFAFPSRYEGFGLPVLEAMGYGTPVVASDAASIPEVGGDAALYAPAGDAEALAAQLARVLDDPSCATALRERGIARAALFSWDRCAAATLDALERAAAERAA